MQNLQEPALVNNLNTLTESLAPYGVDIDVNIEFKLKNNATSCTASDVFFNYKNLLIAKIQEILGMHYEDAEFKLFYENMLENINKNIMSMLNSNNSNYTVTKITNKLL